LKEKRRTGEKKKQGRGREKEREIGFLFVVKSILRKIS
jgi:hypothetical protein